MDGSIVQCSSQRKRLLEICRGGMELHHPQVRLRAHIVLLLSQGHSWSLIAVAILGIAGLLGRLAAVLVFFGLSLLAGCAVAAAHPGDHYIRLIGSTNAWPSFLSYFSAGMVLRVYPRRPPPSLAWLVLASAGCVALLGWAPGFVCALALPILVSYAIINLAFAQCGAWLENVGNRGDLSYGVYIYAFPIQQLCVWGLGVRTPWALFVVATPITLLVAAASWKLVEGPFLRMKPRPVRAAKPTSAAESSVVEAVPG